MVQLRKGVRLTAPVQDDLKSQRYAELEAAYKQQLRALRSMLRAARGHGRNPLKSRSNKV